MNRRADKGRLAPFVPLLKDTLSTPAWRAMSHGARSLYVCLKLRYSSNIKNNAKLYLSTRAAAHELGSNRDAVLRWFRELQHYGFIVMTDAGCLGVDGKGKAPHWRLTEIGYMSDPPTGDFRRWDGTKFRDGKKQNPGPESGARVAAKAGPLLAPKAGPPLSGTGPETGAISLHQGGPKNGAITSSTTRVARVGTLAEGEAAPGMGHNSDPHLDDLDLPEFLRRDNPSRAFH
jgi:hypothetical protein